jgi:hypothetical protein
MRDAISPVVPLHYRPNQVEQLLGGYFYMQHRSLCKFNDGLSRGSWEGF